MKFYVIIDTNVIASALYTKNENSPTVKVLEKLYSNDLILVYSDDIFEEYKDVLNRDYFDIPNSAIRTFINFVKDNGIRISHPNELKVIIPDMDDLIFYELVMDKTFIADKFLITGNIKDYPNDPRIVTPAEFMEIFNSRK